MTTSDEQIWLASVGAGRWQIAGILSAQHAGIKVLALDGDAAAPGLSVADQSMVVDIRNPQAVVDAVANNGLQLAGAISFAAEVGMRAVGALRDRFALPGPGLDVLGTLCDKAAQRKLWQEAGLANPRFWHAVDNSKQGHAAIADAGEPVIVKPIDSAGSRGITRLAADAGEPEQAAALERAFAASPSGRVIVESILPGREYTVETFADGKTTHVLAVTVKRKVPNTSDTVADELATPDDDPDVLAAISALARRSLETVGYIEGPGHVEVMYAAESGPALVEAAGRGAGYMMFERFVPLASGYDIVTATALQAVDRTPPPISEDPRSVVIRFFPSRPGHVRGFSGFEQANAQKGVEAGTFVTIGDRTLAASTDGDRLGYILAVGESPREARQRANEAEHVISIDVTASL